MTAYIYNDSFYDRIGGIDEAPDPRDFFSDDELDWLVARIEESQEVEPFDDNPVFLAGVIAHLILDREIDAFAEFIGNFEPLVRKWMANPDFLKTLLLCLEYACAADNGFCLNWLGAMYYMGEFVEQNYERAKFLYERADLQGEVQAAINLGYIYEYGRVGDPDPQKAFAQYAKAAALWSAPEALYKLGDMYRSGKAVEADPNTAFAFYHRSLEEAGSDLEMQAQPAIRLAEMMSENPMGEIVAGIPYEPLEALRLYQVAEVGLRISIAKGLTYYEKRLQQAIEGQEKVRHVLEESPSLYI